MKKLIRFFPLVFFMSLAFLLGLHISSGTAAARIIHTQPTDPMVGKPLPAFSLDILDSDKKLTQQKFKGKPYLLNIMASWCGPCKMEHEDLRNFSESRRIPVYAIAWKDKPEAVAAYLEKKGNFYAEVALDPKSEFAIALGSRGVPETYLIDAQGKIVAVHRGMVTEPILLSRFDEELKKLRGE